MKTNFVLVLDFIKT